ncbi:MAG: peptidoglycan editing factor PgeF [Mycobacteriales bacterium]
MAGQFVFTGRAGGVSRPPYESFNLASHVGDDPASVAENRRRLASRWGGDVAFMEQVHGSGVEVLTEAPGGPVPEVDALVTRTPGLALAVLVADCIPLLLLDRRAGVAAGAHAGRAGLVAGVVPATVERMCSLGADPARIEAVIGPCIGPCCYKVSGDLRAQVEAEVPGTAATARGGGPAIDLRAGACGQLADIGVVSVRVLPICTAESRGLFSFRRDRRTGRFAGVVRLWR